MSARRTHEDFSQEVQAHLDLETDRLVAEGWTPEAARAAARRSFGNVVSAKERFYESGRWMWLEQLAQDLRYAVRGLSHSPAFLATTVLTLAVGLGLVTVVFTVFNAYVLRTFAVRDPGSLHQLAWRSQEGGGQIFRWRDYEDLRGRSDLFESVVAYSTRLVSSQGRPLATALVSDNFFEALGPAVLLGRTPRAGDAASSSGPTAVLSHEAWSRLYSRDPGALGRDIDLNGRPLTIIGVLRPEFTGLNEYPTDVWVPFTAYAPLAAPDLIGLVQKPSVEITGRLRNGIGIDHASSALSPAMSKIIQETTAAAESNAAVRAEIWQQSSPIRLTLDVVVVLVPVFAAFALVLGAACANVSNVMLARAISRRREIAVRLSLGAGRGRIIRQLLTEGLVIAVLAGFAGLVLAAFALRAATAMFVDTLPASVADIIRIVPIDIDLRVFLFALAAAATTTLMFALIPAIQASRLSLIDTLRGQGGSARHGSRLRSALVIGQVAVSLVLVVAALTLARNGRVVSSAGLGYETDGVISVNVRGSEYELIPRLAAVLQSDPRIAAVAVTGGNPLFVRARSAAASPAGGAFASGTRYTFVSPDYFTILRLPIASGRGFRADEARTGARVAIVSAATAHAFWPGRDPVGQTIAIERPEGRPVDELPGYSRVTVVGTTRDVISGMMVDGRDEGHIYLPADAGSPHARALLIRGRTDREPGPEVRQELFQRAAADPQAFEAISLDEIQALQMYPLRAASWVGSVLGMVALALSVSGLYGVLTFMLSQRTREIGIRMALGATAGAVVRLVMRQSARLAGAGAALGLAVAFAVMQLLNSAIKLENVSFLDFASFAAGLAIVLGAAAVAAYHPARRATRVDPSTTLRADA